MIHVKTLNYYKDGGSIGIDCYIDSDQKTELGLEDKVPLIVIDTMKTETPGAWKNGFGGNIIKDELFKLRVIEACQIDLDQQQKYLNMIKDRRELIKF